MSIPFEDFEIIAVPEVKHIEDKKVEQGLLVAVLEKDFIDNEALLKNILKAINFEIGSNAYLLLLKDSETYNIAELRLKLDFSSALVFYVPSKRLGLNIRILKNKLMKTEGFNMVYTNSLTDISKNRDNKKALWDCLSKEFGK